MKNITEELKWLYGLQRFGSRLGLERIEKIMELLGNPHKDMIFIHIAGTNGKGSTGAMIASVLKQAGFRTGLYTSPHLVRFNERIQINGIEITDNEAVETISRIRKVMENNDIQLTFFEFVTAVVFVYFREQKTDYVVAEVGVGGRYDATNIIMPLVSVITNIDMDHTEILGDDKLKIAKEKAGIVKKGIPLITSEKDENVIGYLTGLCKKMGCRMVQTNETENEIREKYNIGLLGKHQVLNASCALLVCKELEIDDKDIQAGLSNVQWPGRIDIREWNGRKVVLDCAHNSAGMECFVEYIKSKPGSEKRVFVVGFSQDKDIENMFEILSKIIRNCDAVYATKSDFKPAEVSYVRHVAEKILKKNGINADVEMFENAKDAVENALENEATIIITGSIYLIGKILQQRNDNPLE